MTAALLLIPAVLVLLGVDVLAVALCRAAARGDRAVEAWHAMDDAPDRRAGGGWVGGGS